MCFHFLTLACLSSLSCFRLGRSFSASIQCPTWCFDNQKHFIPFPTYLCAGFLPGTLPALEAKWSI